MIATIIIPVLEQNPDWLDRCVKSALAQSVPTEVIVVHAQRTPRAQLTQLNRLAATNPVLRVLEEQSPGFAGALNTGIRAASATRVGLLLSDDWIEPTAVEETTAVDADIVSTGLNVYDADGCTCFHSLARTPTLEAFQNCASIERRAAYLEHFLLFRKSTLLASGGVDESVGLTGADDFDLIWTLLENGASVAVLPRKLYCYRDHDDDRLSLRSRRDQLRDLSRILAKHGIEGRERWRLLREHSRWFGQPVHVAAAGRVGRKLPSDLLALAATRPASLREAVSLNPQISADRAAFRLGFTDGTTLKGRILETPQQARTVERHLPRLSRQAFPRVVARRCRALLEEWVEGVPLGPGEPGEDLAQACGKLLGQVHCSEVAKETRPNGEMSQLNSAFDALVNQGVVEVSVANEALHLAGAATPPGWECGLTHGDFCGENLILDAAGAPHVVDNETLDLDAYDYDLARTWYRWPLPAKVWEAFLAGYSEHRDARPFLQHFDFWALRVLVDSVCFRLRTATLDPNVPLRRLTAYVQGKL